MSPEKRIPNWARRERLHDLGWLNDNLHVFWPAAQQQYQELGRGALVVDTTVQPEERKGNPFGYVPQQMIEEGDDADLKRMVREYAPDRELVVTLLKAQERMSSYRIQVRGQNKSRAVTPCSVEIPGQAIGGGCLHRLFSWLPW